MGHLQCSYKRPEKRGSLSGTKLLIPEGLQAEDTFTYPVQTFLHVIHIMILGGLKTSKRNFIP